MIHHVFEPRIYHNTIGSHEPVLYIKDGDQVSTTTLDASGRDSNNEQVFASGNPQTGPFYINGAEAGDTLAVTLNYLAPNRKIGFTFGVIGSNVLDFGYIPKFEDDTNRLEWMIDLENKTASPLKFDPLKYLKLPLNPMVGCFGVAPPCGQSISKATSNTHGGNMDYRGFVQGVTIYFPVFVPGALFHIGDGHALQGDGEIVGTGIEISLNVTFTVRLIKGREIHWPRAENDTYIMTVGNARPLDQAVQHATTEMINMLKTDYGLDPRAIHILLGQAIEYDLGNMFDPAYTMICKMSKTILNSIGASRY